MSTWIWALVLVAAVWATHWGAEQMGSPLKKLRRQWGLTEAAGAAFLALVTASPEVGINATSAVRGVSDIGLGNMLGSNIISIPLMITVAYLASRTAFSRSGGGREAGKDRDEQEGARDEGGNASQKEALQQKHERHRREHLLQLNQRSVTVLALPYLGILALVAALTLPAPWRGLQPIDGWIMIGAYLLYLTQAALRGRQEGEDVSWTKKEIGLAVAGALAVAGGAYFVVRATENIVTALGISEIVGGLFITSTMATAPEVFKTWSVVRGGQVTAGTTSVIADNAVTMTLGFLPLALVTVPVQDLRLYWVSLAFAALMPALYAAFVHWGSREHGFKRWQVLAFDAAYLAYVAVMLFWVLGVFGQGGNGQQGRQPSSQKAALESCVPPAFAETHRHHRSPPAPSTVLGTTRSPSRTYSAPASPRPDVYQQASA